MQTVKSYRKYNYDKKLLPNPYLRRVERGVKNLDQAIKRSGYTIGYPGWNLLYYTTLCSLRENEENLIIETGTNLGFSTIILAQALNDSGYKGLVHTVELEKINYDQAMLNIRKAKLSSLVKAINGDSIKFLNQFVLKKSTIIVAFLDSDHSFKHIMAEFETIYPCLDDKSMIFFDNTAMVDPVDGRVNKALKVIRKKYGGNLVNFPNSSWSTTGQAIWQKGPFK